MAEELIKYHVLRFEALRSDRYNFDNQWEEAALRLLPAHRNTFQWYGANAIQQGQNTVTQANANNLAYLSQLMGFGQNAFNNDMQTAQFGQGQYENEQDYLLRLLEAGYGA